MQDALALAIEALSWIEHERLGERAAFARAMRQLRVTEPDQLRTAQLLILETTRRRNFIDYLIQKASDGRTDPDSLQHGITSFMRIFCYWAKFHRASDDDLVRILRAARSVLGWKAMYPIEYLFGRILSSNLREATAGLSADEAQALDLFHPAWFAHACTNLLGRSAALRLMQRNLHAASSYIRVSTLREGEETCLREIERAEIKVEPVDKLPLTFKVLSSRRPIVRTKPYRDGIIAVQDKGSILASVVAAPKPGDSVLDICAAPGAKTTHLAQLMENEGVIYSVDRSSDRMSFWMREISRLGVEIAHPVLADARKPLPMNTQADVVVLDPPCSNTGTFWRSPAAKWIVTPERVRHLAVAQSSMLENVAHLVSEGGTLVYSTCTVLAEENEQIVNHFLRANPDFKAVESSPRIGLPGFYSSEKCQRLYPHIHDCNGHFLSKMKRVD